MKIGKVHIYYFCMLLFMIQPSIEKHLGWFKYYDEAIVLVLVIDYLFHIKYRNIKKIEMRLLLALAVLIIIGLVGNIQSYSEQPVAAIIIDILSNAKLILFFMAIQCIKLTPTQKNKLADLLALSVRIIFVLMFVTAIISQFLDIGMTSGERYKLKSYQFIFFSPAGLNTYCYLYMILHSITMLKNGKMRPYTNLFTLFGIIPWVLTLRSRAIAFAILYIAIYIFIIYLKNDKREYKFRWNQVIAAGMAAFLLSWDAIEKYFISNEKAARYQLLKTSFKIAKDFFPIGTGFGTFGTEASKAYYSSIYFKYGLTGIYGLTADFSAYVTDQYWFGILGQFGVMGCAVVIAVIYYMYKKIWSISKQKKNTQLAALTLFMTSIFASITAGTFIQASILPSVMAFFLLNDELPINIFNVSSRCVDKKITVNLNEKVF